MLELGLNGLQGVGGFVEAGELFVEIGDNGILLIKRRDDDGQLSNFSQNNPADCTARELTQQEGLALRGLEVIAKELCPQIFFGPQEANAGEKADFALDGINGNVAGIDAILDKQDIAFARIRPIINRTMLFFLQVRQI